MSKTTLILVALVVAFLFLKDDLFGTPTVGGRLGFDPFGQPVPAPNYGYAPPAARSTSATDVINTLVNVGGSAYRDYLRYGQSGGVDADFVNSLPV